MSSAKATFPVMSREHHLTTSYVLKILAYLSDVGIAINSDDEHDLEHKKGPAV